MREERAKILKSIENVLDRYVKLDLQDKNIKTAIFRLTFLANEIDKPAITLYNYNVYAYLKREYKSVTYLQNKGKIKIDLNTWVKERGINQDQENDTNE